MTQDDRYSRGKIYKLVSDLTDQIYIGSCCVPLRKRLCEHKSEFKTVRKNPTKSIELFKLGGKVEIILIEEYPCGSKMELERRERYHIENNICVNRLIPARTREELLEYQKEYREVNREAICERHKEYHKVNREAICERHKEYYEANKGALLEKQKERVNCPHCNKEINRSSLSLHIKSQHS